MAEKDKDQMFLIDPGTWWDEHWKGMPEFVQKDLTPFKTIYVHFEKREDFEAFAKLVGQRILMSTQSIWYPEMEYSKLGRYVDAPPPVEQQNEDVEIIDEDEETP
jgi:hypothetical protein